MCPSGMSPSGASCVPMPPASSAAPAAAYSASPPQPSAGGCVRDSECKGTRICENGRCIDRPQNEETRGGPGTVPQVLPFPQVAPAQPGQYPVRPAPAQVAPHGEQPALTDSVATVPLPPSTVPVYFEGAGGYLIRADTEAGVAECISPCTLKLKPGRASIEVVGYFARTIIVPNRATTASISLLRTGWLLTGSLVGGLGLAGGIVMSQFTGSGGEMEFPELTAAHFAGAACGIVAFVVALFTHDAIIVKPPDGRELAWSSLDLGIQPTPNGGVAFAGGRF